jgi:beta-glucanase (GH16 family)
MYMVVNLAVGGAAGEPNADFGDGAEMQIDYIHAYALDEVQSATGEAQPMDDWLS